MAATSIQWTDHSINPIRARLKSTGAVGHYCEKIAPGCAHCYSSRMQLRFKMPEFGSGQKRDDVEIFLDESKLEEVRRRKKPTKYFWCDMTDIFGDWMQQEWLDAIFATIDATPQHTHQLLTKRPENIRKMWPDCPQCKGKPTTPHRNNVWLGVSVSDQATYDKLSPHLESCRDLSPVLFLSAEPLLGFIDFDFACERRELSCIDWVIVGGESGGRARPMHPNWARSARDQCAAADVPFFLKQWGEYGPDQVKPTAFSQFRAVLQWMSQPQCSGWVKIWLVACWTAESGRSSRRWSMVERIQRKRTKGWRLPENTLCVTRPTIWGNPWVGPDAVTAYRLFCEQIADGVLCLWTIELGLNVECKFRKPIDEWKELRELMFQYVKKPTDVACFCPLDQPCHGNLIKSLPYLFAWRRADNGIRSS